MKKLFSLCLISMATALGASDLHGQTTIDDITYTLNSAGTAYTVTGFNEGLVNADIQSAIEGVPVTTINQGVFKSASTLK